jgi:hypothetical protein
MYRILLFYFSSNFDAMFSLTWLYRERPVTTGDRFMICLRKTQPKRQVPQYWIVHLNFNAKCSPLLVTFEGVSIKKMIYLFMEKGLNGTHILIFAYL